MYKHRRKAVPTSLLDSILHTVGYRRLPVIARFPASVAVGMTSREMTNAADINIGRKVLFLICLGRKIDTCLFLSLHVIGNFAAQSA